MVCEAGQFTSLKGADEMSTTTSDVSTPVGSSHVLQATRGERGVVVPEEHKLSAPAEKLERIGGNVTSIYWAFGDWTSAGQGSHITTDPIFGVNRLSQVTVSITELDANDVPFIASAGMAVYNVVPQDGGKVTVHWWVGWNSPLRIRLNYIVVN
jgi:hypothetical protein